MKRLLVLIAFLALMAYITTFAYAQMFSIGGSGHNRFNRSSQHNRTGATWFGCH